MRHVGTSHKVSFKRIAICKEDELLYIQQLYTVARFSYNLCFRGVFFFHFHLRSLGINRKLNVFFRPYACKHRLSIFTLCHQLNQVKKDLKVDFLTLFTTLDASLKLYFGHLSFRAILYSKASLSRMNILELYQFSCILI